MRPLPFACELRKRGHQEMSDVDVVVLTWNRLQESVDCIESVLAQKGVDLRLWIIDQGSDAPVLEKLGQYTENSHVQLIKVGKNLGVPAGRNLGMSLGQAPVIVSIDNDATLCQPETLRAVVKDFKTEPQLGALAFAIFDQQGGPDVSSWGYPWPVSQYFQRRFDTARFCGAGHALRRRALEGTRGYDEQLFFFGEELELCYQLAQLGFKIVYEPRHRVIHKVSTERRIGWSSGRFYYNVRNMIYINYRHFRSPLQLMTYAFGYLIKGAYNRQFSTALEGVLCGLKLIWQSDLGRPLSPPARDYVERHELAPRGSLFERLSGEVFFRMRESLNR